VFQIVNAMRVDFATVRYPLRFIRAAKLPRLGLGLWCVSCTVIPWAVFKTYTKAEVAILISGTAIVKDFILIDKIGNATSSAIQLFYHQNLRAAM
jgi:hypothetical protein